MRRRRSPYSWRVIEAAGPSFWVVTVAVLLIGLLGRWLGWW